MLLVAFVPWGKDLSAVLRQRAVREIGYYHHCSPPPPHSHHPHHPQPHTQHEDVQLLCCCIALFSCAKSLNTIKLLSKIFDCWLFFSGLRNMLLLS